VTITKVDGPGEIVRVDSIFYWTWKPDAAAVGQTYTVKLNGKANRNGAQKDQAVTTFSVTVDKMVKANVSPYFPENKKTHEGEPHTAVDFKANEQFANLDGSYRTEIYLDGQKVKEANEPTIDFTPEFKKDEKKSLEVKAYYKSPFMKDYVLIDDQTFKIGPPRLLAVPSGPVDAGDVVQIKAAYSLEEASKYMEIGSDHLDVESGGYFESTAKKEGGKGNEYFFDLKPTGKINSIKKKDGQDIQLSITDPITSQLVNGQGQLITVMPKIQQKGRGAGGGGGIH
jgi:hypothetical protein